MPHLSSAVCRLLVCISFLSFLIPPSSEVCTVSPLCHKMFLVHAFYHVGKPFHGLLGSLVGFKEAFSDFLLIC